MPSWDRQCRRRNYGGVGWVSKKRFTSEDEASQEASGQAYPYFCSTCSHWHLATKPYFKKGKNGRNFEEPVEKPKEYAPPLPARSAMLNLACCTWCGESLSPFEETFLHKNCEQKVMAMTIALFAHKKLNAKQRKRLAHYREYEIVARMKYQA